MILLFSSTAAEIVKYGLPQIKFVVPSIGSIIIFFLLDPLVVCRAKPVTKE